MQKMSPGKNISVTIGGEKLPLQDTPLQRVATPMSYLAESLTMEQQAALWRAIDARQLIEGNTAVVWLDGGPRGRYQLMGATIGLPRYIHQECEAYRWILQNLNPETAENVDLIARLEGGLISAHNINIIELGKYRINTEDAVVGFGGAIGISKVAADQLAQAYQDYDNMQRSTFNGNEHGVLEEICKSPNPRNTAHSIAEQIHTEI
jgi:hypothetical protein